MILLAAAGPKIFMNHRELLKNEFILWQEHNQILISEKEQERPFDRHEYAISWDQPAPREVVGRMAAEGCLSGEWRARARDGRVDMIHSITNESDHVWPVAEMFFCYKHRSAVDFWNPDLDRTYVEWEGQPICVRDRIKQMHGDQAFWPKNQFHIKQFADTYDRYDRVGLRNSPKAGWCAHRDGTTGAWMAVVSQDGEWLSGMFWERAERVAQNGPDYGCIHAGLHIGYDIEPGETVQRKGTIVIDRMSPKAFMELYHGEVDLPAG
jgi:hypothetical protein